MTHSKSVKTLVVGVVMAGLLAPAPSHAYPTPARAAHAVHTSTASIVPVGQPQYEHTTKNSRARGKFQCGDLALRATRGREIEVQDAYLRNGILRIAIHREWRHVTMAGSDGLTYRASGGTMAWFVLEDPDFDNPVRGLEVIQLFFHRGPTSSPGWLRETIEIKHGDETDAVSGPCDFVS